MQLCCSGDLIAWDFTGGSPLWLNLSASDGQKGHYRIVFTLTLFCGGTKLMSTSMDRNLIIWKIKADNLSGEPITRNQSNADQSEIELEEHIPGILRDYKPQTSCEMSL